jgi:hypothetical protein
MKYLLAITMLICAHRAPLALGKTPHDVCVPGDACEYQQACFTEPCPTVPGTCSQEGICIPNL